jgi:hypothetical protein
VPLWVIIRWDGEWSSLIYVHGTQRGWNWNCEIWRSIGDIQIKLEGCTWWVDLAWRIDGNGRHSDKVESVEVWRNF